MHENQNETPVDLAEDAIAGADENRIVIAVVRSGGFAGLRRRWRVEPAIDAELSWMALVDRCPWDERIESEQPGADRYVWSIHARLRDEQRQQVVPDALLQGAWRELVDAVRDADDGS